MIYSPEHDCFKYTFTTLLAKREFKLKQMELLLGVQSMQPRFAKAEGVPRHTPRRSTFTWAWS